MSGKIEMNSKAVVSLIFGILSIIVPLIGLLLGIIGVMFSRRATREIVQNNENGKGFATSGLICSVVGIVIQSLLVLSLIAFNSLTTIN